MASKWRRGVRCATDSQEVRPLVGEEPAKGRISGVLGCAAVVDKLESCLPCRGVSVETVGSNTKAGTAAAVGCDEQAGAARRGGWGRGGRRRY